MSLCRYSPKPYKKNPHLLFILNQITIVKPNLCFAGSIKRHRIFQIQILKPVSRSQKSVFCNMTDITNIRRKMSLLSRGPGEGLRVESCHCKHAEMKNLIFSKNVKRWCLVYILISSYWYDSDPAVVACAQCRSIYTYHLEKLLLSELS